YAPRKAWLLRAYEGSRLFAAISERAYRLVASHRGFFSSVQAFVFPENAPTYELSSWLFVRVLGAIYLPAFVSLWVQVAARLGPQGILPLGRPLAAAERAGSARFLIPPTLSWLEPSSGLLHVLCGGGVALSLLLVLGVAPPLTLFLLWAFYLSLSIDGREFL